ncbi:MAG: alpha/beta hydrolase family protein [Candidatus Rokuibacteriota bacterium]
MLTHGAGGNAGSPLLVALASVWAARGLTVHRYDLPYRQARSTGPPRPESAETDRAGLREAVESMRKLVPGRVFLGGQSYGGRQASILAAGEPGLVAALLLLAYPLHPPRRRGDLRTAHLPELRTPTLFVSGARDPFGSLEELEAARRLVPARTALLAMEGAGHDLARTGRRSLEDVAAEIARAFVEFASSVC